MQSNRIAGRWREIRSRQAINRDKSWINAMHWSNYSQHILMQIRSKVNRAAASRNFSTEIFLPDELPLLRTSVMEKIFKHKRRGIPE